jgi:hypothetical protein
MLNLPMPNLVGKIPEDFDYIVLDKPLHLPLERPLWHRCLASERSHRWITDAIHVGIIRETDEQKFLLRRNIQLHRVHAKLDHANTPASPSSVM